MDSTNFSKGNVRVTPEYGLTLLERTSNMMEKLVSQFRIWTIDTVELTLENILTYTFTIISALKYISSLSFYAEEAMADKIIFLNKSCGIAANKLLQEISGCLPGSSLNGGGLELAKSALLEITGAVESFISINPAEPTNEDDLVEYVEGQIKNVAQDIGEALKRLEGLVTNSDMSQKDLAVHSSILEAAINIGKSISFLIKKFVAKMLL